MKIRISIKEIYSTIVAFVMTDGFLLEYISRYAGQEVGATVGRVALYLVVVLSIIIIAIDFSRVKRAVLPLSFLLTLGLYQAVMFTHPVESSYIRDFIIQGVGGLLLGISINEYLRIIKKAGCLSFIYGLFLIAEPINGRLLQINTMSLGYTIIPYVIWMFATVFICGRKQYWMLICAIPLAITTILFTSRGCGLSIIIAVFLLYILKMHAKGEKVYSKLFVSILGVFFIFLIFSFAMSFGFLGNAGLSEGSTLYKILNGSFYSSNGRGEIWEFGIYTIKNNWMTGIGFGNDIELAKSWMSHYSFIHNVFLDLFLHFGIPIGLLIVFFYTRKIVLSIKGSDDFVFKGFIIAMTFSYCFMLLFSSQYLSHLFQIMLIFGACANHYEDNKENKYNT